MKYPLFDLEGQVAIVTGAASGLGRAMAEGLSAAGSAVVLVDVDEAALREVEQQLKAGGAKASSVAADVSSEADVIGFVDHAVKTFGRLDAIFNNAGINGPTGLTHEVSLADWQRCIDVDLTGVFLGSREAAKVMVKQGRGKIINTASVWGLVGSAMKAIPAYAAAKGGVVNFTREMALEYGPLGICVNAIAPVGFSTNIAGGITFKNPELKKKLTSLIPLDRVAQPEEIQGLAIYLASRASDYMTGAVIPLDGGYSAR